MTTVTLEDEAEATLREFDTHYRRITWGQPGYGDLRLGMDVEWRLTRKRAVMLIQEHSEAWNHRPGPRPTDLTTDE